MSNCIDFISRAMRRIGVLAGGQLPRDTELNDGLETLKALLLRSVSEGALGELVDVIAEDGDYEAAEFTRVYRNSVDTASITLPDAVADDCGNLRPPHDKAVIVISDKFAGQTITYIFDGDLKQWLPVETMTLTSVPPLAERDANGFAAYLAVELADEYGQPVEQATIMAATRFHSNVINGWSRPYERTARPENYF